MRKHRTVGDVGPSARLKTRVLANDQPVTFGTVTLAVGSLFVGDMTHDEDGWWYYDPVAGDIDRRGIFPMEIRYDGVALPSEKPDELHVRDRVAAP